MCLIVIDDKGKGLDAVIADKAADTNRHGYGRLNLRTGEVHRTMDMKEAVLMAQEAVPAIHHFRIASAGKVCFENLHPFEIGNGWYLFMNGTCNSMVRPGETTDTEAIARVLEHVKPENFKHVLRNFDAKFVAATVGQWAHSGSWYKFDDMLYSNLYSMPHVRIGVYGTLRMGYQNHWNTMKGSKYIGIGETAEEHRMFSAGTVPILVQGPGKHGLGKKVVVELHDVPMSTLLENIDILEGHPEVYRREPADIITEKGELVSAFVYFYVREVNEKKMGVTFADWKKERPPITPVTYGGASNYHHRPYSTGFTDHHHHKKKDRKNRSVTELTDDEYAKLYGRSWD